MVRLSSENCKSVDRRGSESETAIRRRAGGVGQACSGIERRKQQRQVCGEILRVRRFVYSARHNSSGCCFTFKEHLHRICGNPAEHRRYWFRNESAFVNPFKTPDLTSATFCW